MKKFFEIHFEIEDQCSLNCKHCSSYDLKMNQKSKFSLEDAKVLIKIVNDSTHIYLTGGEPLINKNLLEIIKNIKESKPSLNIGLFTCGVINSNNNLSAVSIEEASTLRLAGLSNIYISMYHYNPAIHDYITNQTSSFEYSKQSIINLKSVGIEVRAHLTLNKQNINDLDKIIMFLSDLGVVEVRLLRLVYHGNAIRNWPEIGLLYEVQNEAIYRIFKKSNEFPIKITISGFPSLTACRPFENATLCQGGTNVFYINLKGEVYPCACTKNSPKFKIGHMSEINKILEYINSNKIDYNLHCLNPLNELNIKSN